MVTEAELDHYIETHLPDTIHYTPFTRDFWREQAEADRRHKAQIATKADEARVEAREIAQLRKRVATLEQGLLAEGGWFVKAVGQAIGEMHAELERRIAGLEISAPVPLPVPDWNNPTVHYCGLWNAKNLYGPGAMVTYNGAGWIAMSAMGAGVKPGDGPTGWRLAIKGDPTHLKVLVRDEVRKQMRERT
jgi:hypothetical protein